MSEAIDYVDYQKRYSFDGRDILEMRRDGIVYVADDGRMELDGVENLHTGEELVFLGWGNGGPRFQEWFEAHEAEIELPYFFIEEAVEPDAYAIAKRAWELIEGEEAEMRLQYWLSKLPADEVIHLNEEDLNEL